MPTLETDSPSHQRRQFPPGRSLVMIDGPSIYVTLRALNVSIDYRLLHSALAHDMQLIHAIYYALTERGAEHGMHRLLDWLAYNGYVVHEKFGRVFVDAHGRRSLRGRISLEMAIDALEMAPLIDHLVLFSGDGDLTPMVRAVQRKGVRVTAVSTVATAQPMIASELRRQVDRFVELREMSPLVKTQRSELATDR